MRSAKSNTARELSAEALQALQRACDQGVGGSQVKAAAQLGVSSATVNQLLKGRYPGDVGRMETKIRGELLRETVACPVMGDLSKRSCLDYQRQPYAPTNPQRARLYKACQSCPNREKKEAS
jgi:DNA-binding transcriptional regulator YdaS (Cro superfamily)